MPPESFAKAAERVAAYLARFPDAADSTLVRWIPIFSGEPDNLTLGDMRVALTALRAMAGGQEAWQAMRGGAVFYNRPDLTRVLIVEAPDA